MDAIESAPTDLTNDCDDVQFGVGDSMRHSSMRTTRAAQSKRVLATDRRLPFESEI